jgi:DNA-binding NarL/FixJ family response regulator
MTTCCCEKGLTRLLTESGFEVVGRTGNPVELLALVRERKPDLVIVDIRMPPTHTTEGLDAARVIRQELPDTAILDATRAPPHAAGREGWITARNQGPVQC